MSPGPWPTQIEQALSRSGGVTVGRFRNLRLESRFQPILSIAHRRIVGHEALLRGFGPEGGMVPPVEVFKQAALTDETFWLDRVSRTMHVHNFFEAAAPHGWLFLNVSPSVIADDPHHGSFFDTLLHRTALPPHRVVVEILESAIGDEQALAVATDYYRSIGCLLAIDDFGIGHSNLERVWRIHPDLVKLDRSVLVAAVENSRMQRLLENVVALLHEAGCLVLLEGVEREDEVLMAMDVDADFIQGYFVSPPSHLDPDANACGAIDLLCQRFRRKVGERIGYCGRRFESYRAGFLQAQAALAAGAKLADACHTLRVLPDMKRCYLLASDGTQTDANVDLDANRDPRFAPLADARGASWFRRAYFRNAIANPGLLQETRPYLSITGAHLCVTFSLAFEHQGKTVVLCCDIEWRD